MALCNLLREYLISSLSLSRYFCILSFPLKLVLFLSLPISLSLSSFLSSRCETSLLPSPRDTGLLLVSLRAEFRMKKKALHADGCKLHLTLPLSADIRNERVWQIMREWRLIGLGLVGLKGISKLHCDCKSGQKLTRFLEENALDN